MIVQTMDDCVVPHCCLENQHCSWHSAIRVAAHIIVIHWYVLQNCSCLYNKIGFTIQNIFHCVIHPLFYLCHVAWHSHLQNWWFPALAHAHQVFSIALHIRVWNKVTNQNCTRYSIQKTSFMTSIKWLKLLLQVSTDYLNQKYLLSSSWDIPAKRSNRLNL